MIVQCIMGMSACMYVQENYTYKVMKIAHLNPLNFFSIVVSYLIPVNLTLAGI